MNQDYNELKRQAAEFYTENQVPARLEDILNSMFFENPKDIYGRLAEYFEKFAFNPVISSLHGKNVLSSCGEPAIQSSVYATVKNHDQFIASSQVSLHNELENIQGQVYVDAADRPSNEEIVDKNCSNIDEMISMKLKGIPLLNQGEVDKILSDWINDLEHAESSRHDDGNEDGEVPSRTPTPSSGRKKKAPSGKAKVGKAPDKPIPPKEPLESRLKGCTSVFASSISVVKASSLFLNRPPFEHLLHTMYGGGIYSKVMDKKEKVMMPTPAITIVTGGKSSPGKLNLTKNVFAIAKPGWSMEESVKNLTKIYHNVGKGLNAKSSSGVITGASGGFQPMYDKPEQPLDVIMEAINASGLVPGQDVFIGVDCSAHDVFDYDKGKYDISTGTLKSADEMIDFYRDLLTRYPAVVMLIDPLRKEDREQWPKLCEVISEKCFVIGGESIYGSMHSLNANMLSARKSSGVAISNGGRVTCSDLSRIIGDVNARDGVTVMLSPPGDACDDIYTDLGVGLGVDVVRFDAPSRGENTSRLNRLVEVEAFIKQDEKLRIGYQDRFHFPVIKLPPVEPQSDDENDVTQGSPDQKPKKK